MLACIRLDVLNGILTLNAEGRYTLVDCVQSILWKAIALVMVLRISVRRSLNRATALVAVQKEVGIPI